MLYEDYRKVELLPDISQYMYQFGTFMGIHTSCRFIKQHQFRPLGEDPRQMGSAQSDVRSVALDVIPSELIESIEIKKSLGIDLKLEPGTVTVMFMPRILSILS